MNRTVGLSPKVPTQAIVATLTFLLTYFGVELSPELSGVLATVLGIGGGVVAGPGQVEPA